MDYFTQATTHRIIVETLAQLGVPDARFSITDTTVLFQDGFYMGQSFVCGHVRVVIFSGGERIEFYGQTGELLRSIRTNPPFAIQREAA